MWKAIIVGVVTGLIVSLALHLYSRQTSDTRIEFGSKTIIENMIVLNVVFLVVVFGWFSLFVRDVTFPSEHPLLFMLETLLAGILPASTIFFVYYLRNVPLGKHALYGFILLVLKCMLGHVLLQLSGVYSFLLK